MLIRCTHCNHELRVPDQQISATGTRVLCKSCNTIFVARRGGEESARAQSDILPVADDPALEEALDRILDRGPLSEAGPDDDEAGPAGGGAPGEERSGGSAGQDPWAQVSPESLGISLVDDEPLTPPAGALAASGGLPPSETGDDVDQLLDQVLRDLDRQQPAPAPVAPAPPRPAAGSDELLAGLSLEEPSDTVRPAAPPLPAPKAPPYAAALDLESILSEIRSEAEPPAPTTTRIPPPTTTVSSGFELGDDDLGGQPGDLGFGGDAAGSDEEAAGPSGTTGAHEREQSLHDIYESGHGSPLTGSLDSEHLPPATDLAGGTGAIAAASTQRKPRPSGQNAGTGSTRTRTVTAAPRARVGTPSKSRTWLFVLVAVLGAAASGGYWFWTQQNSARSTSAPEAPAPGLPSFAFEQQDGQLVKVKGGLAYVVNGVVRNTSSFAVYIVRVTGVLRGAGGQELAHASSYAGNSIPASSLSGLPRAEVIATLDTRIGEGGSNVKLEPMGALPFTLVFWDAPSDASNPHLSASARSFPAPTTPDG